MKIKHQLYQSNQNHLGAETPVMKIDGHRGF